MIKKMATAVAMGALLAVTGGVFAAETGGTAMPAQKMGKKMDTDKDGMISAQEVMEMERARIAAKMKAMGVKGDKMTQSEWEKMREDLYRGI